MDIAGLQNLGNTCYLNTALQVSLASALWPDVFLHVLNVTHTIQALASSEIFRSYLEHLNKKFQREKGRLIPLTSCKTAPCKEAGDLTWRAGSHLSWLISGILQAMWVVEDHPDRDDMAMLHAQGVLVGTLSQCLYELAPQEAGRARRRVDPLPVWTALQGYVVEGRFDMGQQEDAAEAIEVLCEAIHQEVRALTRLRSPTAFCWSSSLDGASCPDAGGGEDTILPRPLCFLGYGYEVPLGPLSRSCLHPVPLEGSFCHQIRCLACGHEHTHQLAPFKVLNIPLGVLTSSNISRLIPLSECLRRFMAPEVVEGVVCERCSLRGALSRTRGGGVHYRVAPGLPQWVLSQCLKEKVIENGAGGSPWPGTVISGKGSSGSQMRPSCEAQLQDEADMSAGCEGQVQNGADMITDCEPSVQAEARMGTVHGQQQHNGSPISIGTDVPQARHLVHGVGRTRNPEHLSSEGCLRLDNEERLAVTEVDRGREATDGAILSACSGPLKGQVGVHAGQWDEMGTVGPTSKADGVVGSDPLLLEGGTPDDVVPAAGELDSHSSSMKEVLEAERKQTCSRGQAEGHSQESMVMTGNKLIEKLQSPNEEVLQGNSMLANEDVSEGHPTALAPLAASSSLSGYTSRSLAGPLDCLGLLKELVDKPHLPLPHEGIESMVRKLGGSWSQVRRRACKRMVLAHLPPVLVIHLQRSQWLASGQSVKLTGHVAFPLVLDLSPYCEGWTGSSEPEGSSGKGGRAPYHLVAVVVHLGAGADRGHYIVYRCVRPNTQSPVDPSESEGAERERVGAVAHRQWFHVSDVNVRPCCEDEVLASEATVLVYEGPGVTARA